MDLKEKMAQFNKRWNIKSEDSPEEAFSKFNTRILNVFYYKDGIDRALTIDDFRLFFQYYGINMYSSDPVYGKSVIDYLENEQHEKEFYRIIELILSLDFVNEYTKDEYIAGVTTAIELSDVNVSITITNGDVILYPKGEKLLDKELVNSPLSFLTNESAKHFTEALKFYEKKKYVKSAESLRRTLEEFLKNKLDNPKGLKANIEKLQKNLKSDGRDPQIRNIIFSIFSFLDKYFNENSKHKDGNIDEAENEFLIYQVGLLIRYINQIKR